MKTSTVTDLRTGRTYQVTRAPYGVPTRHTKAMALAMRSAVARLDKATARAMAGARRVAR